MYVCVCHAFTEKHVKQALDKGAHSTAAVYRTLGHIVQCGKCVPMVRDMVKDHCAGQCGSCRRGDAAPQSAPQQAPRFANNLPGNDWLAAVAAE